MRIGAILPGTLSRYVAMRFLVSALIVFASVFVLIALVDYLETSRRASDVPNVSAWLVARTSLFRVPQVTERVLPFSVLVGAMACYLDLSRRLELVIARAAGMSAWQFVGPAMLAAFVIGVAATTLYNPLSATLREIAKRYEAEMFGADSNTFQQTSAGYFVRQRSVDGSSIINATTSRDQGLELVGVSAFTFDAKGDFHERIVAKTAVLEPGFWRLSDARVFVYGKPPQDHPVYRLRTNLTIEQVRESFATPETVSFWQLPQFIALAEKAGLTAAGYKVQYQTLLAQPFLLAATVLFAASVSLRFFRFGGVQQMILSGVMGGFLLYVLSKVVEDLSKAELLTPIAAGWLPVAAAGLTGFIVLLYQEDG